MASHLDLEEQEQLDQLKHFWKRWGNLITWVVIAVLAGFAAWNGWSYWQRQQAMGASAMKDALEKALQNKDWALVERAAKDLREQYPKTHATSSGQLMTAKLAMDLGKKELAKESLQWVMDHAKDSGHVSLAQLRLAGLFFDEQNFDQAKKSLNAKAPSPGFEALFEDRLGDLAQAQNQTQDAQSHYTRAYKHELISESLKHVIAVKLAALGIDAATLK